MNRKFRMTIDGNEREFTADEVKAVEFVVKNPESEINENVRYPLNMAGLIFMVLIMDHPYGPAL